MTLQLDKRILAITHILQEHNRPMTSDEIADIIGVSARTIREDISQYKKDLENVGVCIHSHARNGYSVEVQKGFEDSWMHLAQQSSVIPSDNRDKIIYIMAKFIKQSNYLKLDDLCDELWISRSTMNRLFKEVREKFSLYHLQIVSKPGYGLLLKGNEVDRRLCFVQCCLQKKTSNLQRFMEEYQMSSSESEKIQEIILQNLKNYNYKLTDMGFDNLVIHLLVALQRIRNNNVIPSVECEIKTSGIEYLIACDIVEDMQHCFAISFPMEEIEYVRIHLYGKRLTQLDGEEAVISTDMEKMITKINNEIKVRIGYDFNSDFELFTLLSLHMMPLMVRIQYGLDMPNPILSDIKIRMANGYECAVIAADIISNEYEKPMSEGEIGYLAIHYSMAIERMDESQKNRNILIVCSSGMGTSSLLKNRLMKKFNLKDNEVHVCDAQTCYTMDISDVDYIISTVKLDLKTKHPIIYMENLFDDIEIEEIHKEFGLKDYISMDNVFLNQSFSDKNEVFDFISKHIEGKYALDFSFKQTLLEREQLSSTEVGNLVAMPHPLKLCTDVSIVVIITLKKSMLWKNTYVKYIFMIAGNMNSQKECEFITDAVIDIIMSTDVLSEIGKAQNYNDLVKLL